MRAFHGNPFGSQGVDRLRLESTARAVVGPSMICASEHRELLVRMLHAYGLQASTLEIVEDVGEWCKAHGVPDRPGPFRAAVCARLGDDWRIAMRDVQTDGMIASAKDAMFTDYGFLDVHERLDSDINSLVHLLLQEIACIVLGTTEQAPRARWAFAELPKHLP
jgi:hypothetical protein